MGGPPKGHGVRRKTSSINWEILNTDCQPALSLQTLLATVDTTYLQVSCSMIARTDAVLSFSQIFLLCGLGFHDTNTKGTSPVGHVTCSIKSMCGENCKHGQKLERDKYQQKKILLNTVGSNNNKKFSIRGYAGPELKVDGRVQGLKVT